MMFYFNFCYFIKMNSKWWLKESLIKFHSPTTIMVCGPSGSGKTYLTKTILQNEKGMFTTPTSKIIVCYDTWQSMFEVLKFKMENIIFHHGLPNEEKFQEWGDMDGHKLVVIDDCMADGVDSPHLMKMFCVSSHHKNISIIFLVQNVFQKGKVMRTLSLNTHYFILFKNYRDQSQVETLGRQIFPRQVSFFRDAYHKATSDRYGYLLIDVSPHAPDIHIINDSNIISPLRTKILPGENTILYEHKK